MDSIVEKFKQPSTFEDFVASVYSPSQLGTILPGSMKGSHCFHMKHNTLNFSPGGHSTASVSTGSHGRSDISAALLEGVNLVEERRHWEHMGEGMGRPRAHTDHEPRGDHLPLNRTGEYKNRSNKISLAILIGTTRQTLFHCSLPVTALPGEQHHAPHAPLRQRLSVGGGPAQVRVCSIVTIWSSSSKLFR